jgi:hypothetical protein
MFLSFKTLLNVPIIRKVGFMGSKLAMLDVLQFNFHVNSPSG